MKLNHYSKTVIGLVRKGNEDSIGDRITPNNFNMNLHVVCDGMGGHIGGAKASGIAVDSILEYFKNTPDPIPQNALKEAISFANVQIFGYAQANTEFKGMGTTCTVLLESEGLIYIAHVGDSRIYINSDRKLFRITKDHSYVQDLVDNGEITDQQMETHPRKNELTRALGIGINVDVEVATKPILAKEGDKFMLCSDGLSGLINDKMIAAVINSNKSIQEQCHQLIYLAESAGGHDNISVDLIEVLDSEHTTTQFVNKNNEDLINSKTQRITPIKKENKTGVVAFIKSKSAFLSLVLVGALIFLLIESLQTDVPLDGINPETPVTITEFNEKTIKVTAKANWTSDSLNTRFKEVVEKKFKYCKDCPVFYRNSKPKELVSIQKYRKLYKSNKFKLYKGDYLKVTIKDGKIVMPEINKNIGKPVLKNVFSDLIKEKEKSDKAKRDAKSLKNIIIETKRKTEKEKYNQFKVLFDPEESIKPLSKDSTYVVRVTIIRDDFKLKFEFKETVKASMKLTKKDKKKKKKDQEKKDQEKKDQEKKDQEKKDQEKKDQEKKDQDKKDKDSKKNL